MPLVSREKIDDVRERTNIVEVVKRHVELKRAGAGSWKGLCPFHSEKTPSFHVNETRHYFHCFGCNEKGDVIGFLEKIEQRSFMEVLQDLASAAGVELDTKPLSLAEKTARREAESERERMFRVMEAAAQFFQEQYAGPAGAAARAYVEKRGITAAVAGRFRVGYAPQKWDALSGYLAAKKIPASDLERLGLVGVNERGRYDFFRDRVMLPVIDRQKRVIGFGGRVLDPEIKDRKYVNSPDSPLFHKKEQLYGLHAALEPIRKSGLAVVVEGNFDVLSLHEAGVEEAVAPMGTALTAEQLTTLGRAAKRIVVVFDGDKAGRKAAKKSVAELLALDLGRGDNNFAISDACIARLPTGQDPDDFVRSEGTAAFRQLLERARPILDYFIHEVASDSSIPGRMAALDEISSVLVRLQNRTAVELYSESAANMLGLSLAQVNRAFKEARAGAVSTGSRSSAVASAAPAEAAPASLPGEELAVIVLLATYPELLRSADSARAGDLLVHPSLRQLHRTAVEHIAASRQLDVPAWLDTAAPEVRARVAAAMMDDSLTKTDDPPGLLRKLATRLELSRVDAEIDMNSRMQREAQGRGDEATLRALTVRGIELRKIKEGLRVALQRP